MSRTWTERKGGIWPDRAGTSDKLVLEEYDEERDAFTLIWQRGSDSHFQVEYLVKGDAQGNSQWRLPFWGNIAGEGMYGTLSDAKKDLKAIADAYHRELAAPQQNQPFKPFPAP